MDTKDSKQDSGEKAGLKTSSPPPQGQVESTAATTAPATTKTSDTPPSSSASTVAETTTCTTSVSTSSKTTTQASATSTTASLTSTTTTSAVAPLQRTSSPPKRTAAVFPTQPSQIAVAEISKTPVSQSVTPTSTSQNNIRNTPQPPAKIPKESETPTTTQTPQSDSNNSTVAKEPKPAVNTITPITVKRPATSESKQDTPETGDQTESTAGANDAKRRKIRRDFKFEGRDQPSSTENTPHRVSFSTAGKNVIPVTSTSSSSITTQSQAPTTTTPVVALVPGNTDKSSSLKVSDSSLSTPTTNSSQPAESGSQASEKDKDNKEIVTTAASSAANSGRGPKVPPIKIVLGSNGNNSGAADSNDHSSTSHHSHGNSPNSSFPYVVSSTTPDTSSSTGTSSTATTGSVTSASTTSTSTISSSSTSTSLACKTEIKKEPGTKIKLVATIGPTGGTLTYSSSSSTTASTTILTTTSTAATAGTGNLSIKQEPETPKQASSTSISISSTTSNSSGTTTLLTTTTATPPTSVSSAISSTVPTLSSSPSTSVSAVESSNDTVKPKVSVQDVKVKSEPTVEDNVPPDATPIKEEKTSASSTLSPTSSISTSKEKEDTTSNEKVNIKDSNSSGSSPPTVSSTTAAVPTPTTTTIPTSSSSATTTTTAATSSTVTGTTESIAKEKPHRVTRSSHRIAANTGASGVSTSSVQGNGHAPSSPATGNSPKNSACSSPAQPDASVPMDTSSSTTVAPSAVRTKNTDVPEKTDSTDSATAELHPRKRKIKSKEPRDANAKEATPSGATTSSSNSSTSGEANETETKHQPNNQTEQPILNCFEMYLNIRKQIEQRRRNLFPVQPKPPQGFKDYLMNRATYVLAGNANSRLAVPLLNSPPNLQIQMKETFIEQEKERHKLRLQHLVEKEKLVLSVEQEILRVHGRAARALSNQALPFSVCTILKDQEVYNLLTPEQEEKDRNARSRYNGRLFLSWLQDVDDKWDKIKESMLLRHHNEAESLAAVQKMNWEWKLKEFGLCEPKATPTIDEVQVPMVHVSDDFDLLPA